MVPFSGVSDYFKIIFVSDAYGKCGKTFEAAILEKFHLFPTHFLDNNLTSFLNSENNLISGKTNSAMDTEGK